MYSITATFGRNVGSTPMTLTNWELFKGDVAADMQAALNTPTHELHTGKGVWQGVEEESAKVTILRESEPTASELDATRRFLSELARQWGQDAIALTIGKSELC